MRRNKQTNKQQQQQQQKKKKKKKKQTTKNIFTDVMSVFHAIPTAKDKERNLLSSTLTS